MTVTKLSDKAVLVKLTMRRAALTKRDNFLTDKIQRQEHDASLTVSTKLFRDKNNPINEVMSALNDVYVCHKKLTLPWVDAGPRLLLNDRYFDYTSEMRTLIHRQDKLLNLHMPDYDQLVLDDIRYRNAGSSAGRAHSSDYPTADTFRQSMSAEFRFQPMPDARHFVFDLSEEDEAAFAQAESEALALANTDTINRMLKPLASLVTKLKEYQGAKGERFHVSLVENVIEGCDMAMSLAISPTPELLAEIAELRDVAKSCLGSVEVIKGSSMARDSAKRRLEDIAAKMSMFQ